LYNNHTFYITVVETAPHAVDLVFYIENSPVKRPVRSLKEVLLYTDDGQPARVFALESDPAGSSMMRYLYREPVRVRIKVSATDADNKPLSAEAVVQIGSPQPSHIFLIIFAALTLFVIIGAYLLQKRGDN